MEEYKILSGTNGDCQKTLNQWRHKYWLTILGVSSDISGDITILLTRKEKSNA